MEAVFKIFMQIHNYFSSAEYVAIEKIFFEKLANPNEMW